MSAAEATAWRERIAIWRRFRAGGQARSFEPVADIPLVDDPDLFLYATTAIRHQPAFTPAQVYTHWKASERSV